MKSTLLAALALTLTLLVAQAVSAPSLKNVLQLSAETERPLFDRKARNFVLRGKLRNTSNAPIAGPLSLVLTSLEPADSSLQLDTVHGFLADGNPFVELMPTGAIEAGAELPVTVRFRLGHGFSRLASAALEKLADRSIGSYQPDPLAAFTFSYDLVRVPAGNHAPLANAGADWSTVPETPVTLDGSASTDEDSDQLSYRWTLIEKPPLSQRDVADATSAACQLNPDVVGKYKLALVVNDGYEDSLPDTVTVTVNADGGTQQNRPPVVISSPATAATGTKPYSYRVEASDPDGDTPLTFTLATSPPGMTMDATGYIQWIPPQPHHDGMTYPVAVDVSDGHGGTVRHSFSISVRICTCA